MVIVGDYSIRLVEAKTKVPFKEHLGPDGAIYAEVEPDLEYYVEIEIVGGDPATWSVFELTIDGKKLKYHSFHLKSDGKIFKGLWSREKHIVTKRAFAFHRPTVVNTCNSGAFKDWAGKVKVDVSQGIPTRKKRHTTVSADSIEPASSINPRQAMNMGSNRKFLRSGEGKHTETTRLRSNGVLSYKRGRLLESETIYYCTTPGLIHAGILIKPHAISVDETEAVANTQPPVKRKKRPNNGTQGCALKDFDFYDLSVIPDDEDDISAWIPARRCSES
jgi:hypothetical protein